ncbi:DUF5776 domain-containing protein [Levilactobacillus tujiorum]|uniref:DUF5776 domain-containing protein n=1 Tax=Levilactobacillus tujiorum TaxID=2912243 RepID=UPI001456518D|nr:DUF5776 domain-containing protein [Levilactobacillus tujiorum]NLR31047.1 hypothetical protein [Levilactobacillus tujiorum]
MVCRTNWKMTVMLAVSLAVLGVGGMSVAQADTAAEPAQVTTVPATTTLNEALPDGGDSGTVKAAILKAASDRNLSFSGSSTLGDIAAKKLIVKITDNMESYEALEKVAGLFNGLVVNNQEDFTSAEMTAITRTFLANRTSGTELAALGFSNDGVTTKDLGTLLTTISSANSAATIKYLLLNRNPITDFSSWTNFKLSATTKNKIYSLNADVLENPDGSPITEGITLAPRTVKNGLMTVPFSEFNEFKDQYLPENAENDDLYTSAGIQAYDGQAGLFDQGATLDGDGTNDDSTLQGRSGYQIVDKALHSETMPYDWGLYWLETGYDEDSTKKEIDLKNVDFIDATAGAGGKFYCRGGFALPYSVFRASMADFLSKGYTFTHPDGQKNKTPNLGDLYILNVPADAKQIKLRTYKPSLDGGTTYTQIYTIPIRPAATPTDNSQSESSSEADSETPPFVKPTVVYATKKIGLYQKPDFSKATRVRWYNQQPRTRRPMFEVMGEAKSTHGTPRYLVKDIDPMSKTYGETGYITKRADYVGSTYYTKAPTKVTVISPKGINAYRRASLTGKVKHCRQGQVLPVVGIKQHNLTTRFKLKDGTYVTANKILVHSGRLPMVKKVVAKTKINRYKDVNLKKRIKPFRKGTKVAVLGYDFSAKGTQRYRVAGGYITANPKLVKAIK